jgi:hypothetical protein
MLFAFAGIRSGQANAPGEIDNFDRHGLPPQYRFQLFSRELHGHTSPVGGLRLGLRSLGCSD